MNLQNRATPDLSADKFDRDRLRRGVSEANVPALLMCLVHLTGDKAWLDSPFAPHRGRGLDDNDSGGLPDELQQAIRDAAYDAILAWVGGRPMAIARPSNLDLSVMLGIAMTEPVPPGYGDVIAASMQLDPMPEDPTPVRDDAPMKAIIIGGGISGICAAMELSNAGIEYRIFEKNSQFGGTWFENHYPGCGVDTPNLTYTFAARPTDWSKYFPPQAEIEGYLVETAQEYGLYDHTHFDARVQRAEWIEARNQWAVTVTHADGLEKTEFADVVFSAVGILNIPLVPEIKGLDSFSGPVVHTSAWDDSIDLTGKQVAVVGNGASAMQLVPAIADQVGELTIFARSKQWAAPFPQFRKPVPDGVRYLMQVFPLYRQWAEQRLSWTFNDRVHGSLYRDPDWTEPSRSVNAINDGHREYFTRYVKEQLGDRQDLLPLVLPDFPPFAKRMLLDNGWYRTLRKPHVTLVPERLVEASGKTLRSTSGAEFEADVLILATGYQATNVLGSYEVVGRGGRILSQYWEGGNTAAYLGTLVPGFPNFFILLGPNVGSGHGGSMIRNIENQTHYAMRIIDMMIDQKAHAVEVREEVYEDYRAQIDAEHEKLVWTHPGTENWYRNEQGRVVAITPWRNDAFWRMTREAHVTDFTLHRAQESGGPLEKKRA